jgi:hypothetical protein
MLPHGTPLNGDQSSLYYRSNRSNIELATSFMSAAPYQTAQTGPPQFVCSPVCLTAGEKCTEWLKSSSRVLQTHLNIMRRRKRVAPPVDTTVVRGTQPLKISLVQSVHFAHLDHDGRVTTESVLDVATMPQAFNNPPSPDAHNEPSSAGFFDIPPSTTFGCSTESTPDSSTTNALQKDLTTFFEIDAEDEVADTTTGEKKVPKRPHQVCFTLNLQRYTRLRATLEERFDPRVHEVSGRVRSHPTGAPR